MKHNFMTKNGIGSFWRWCSALPPFSITAFASGGEESTESVTEQETVWGCF